MGLGLYRPDAFSKLQGINYVNAEYANSVQTAMFPVE
jgi:hypothetical protein